MAIMLPDDSTTFGSFRAGVNPGALTGFLAGMHSVPAVQRIKQRSFQLAGIAAGTRILDVGCGVGVDLPDLAALAGPRGRVVGAEPNQDLAARAAALPCVEVVVASAEQLPFEAATFDVARADRVAHYFPAPVAALAEMARVVAPGGAVVLSECLFELAGADDPDPQMLRHVERRTSGAEVDAAWLGLFLPVLFARAGLGEVEFEWQEEVVSAPEEVALCMNLDWALADVAEPERIARWRDALEADLDGGRRHLLLRAGHFRGRVQ